MELFLFQNKTLKFLNEMYRAFDVRIGKYCGDVSLIVVIPFNGSDYHRFSEVYKFASKIKLKESHLTISILDRNFYMRG
jgi:hypothetical protein